MRLIELSRITKTYTLGETEVPVLKDVSLSIEAGEYVALMGSSGSGKSTLMNILGCLDRPSSGSYKLEGVETTSLSQDERARIRFAKIGFVFQSFNLLKKTSALENVLMPLSYSPTPISETEATERAVFFLERVGLGDRLHHEPSQLSGGQQQRVAIARALVNEPPILLADEPTGNLDSHTTAEILEMFEELNAKDGTTLIIVTHESDVGARAGRRVNIKDGRIV